MPSRGLVPRWRGNEKADAPDLIAEVLSPGTSAKDLRDKKALYERAGVRGYLVVGPPAMERRGHLGTHSECRPRSVTAPCRRVGPDSPSAGSRDTRRLRGRLSSLPASAIRPEPDPQGRRRSSRQPASGSPLA
ncbi:hypothetical protein THSYN_10855 [Candidatus Thiodictyon syntrophicum]|uniref:Putative restriction endonuclease domain-containing protein n=1 Tax=Candidatus Thiodictyon syntrophicum TaxID=1166950 RepID=A0A2K8U738_9GAMM|nr:hypothetical protein THSYN_10855 [Candidatus Thiodictyon syntrophicum]